MLLPVLPETHGPHFIRLPDSASHANELVAAGAGYENVPISTVWRRSKAMSRTGSHQKRISLYTLSGAMKKCKGFAVAYAAKTFVALLTPTCAPQ